MCQDRMNCRTPIPANGTRMLLGKQPARTLLVDINGLQTQPHLVQDFCEALQNVFSIACNFGGPSRSPLFSMFAMTSYPEMLLPLSYVKNNYGRLQTACDDLLNLINESSPSNPNDRVCVVETIQEATNQFYRQTQSTMHQRIQIVTLFSTDQLMEELMEESTSQSSATSNNSGVSGLVDIVHLDTEPLCLQNFFNNWLLDSGTDSEHLHIVLPPTDPGSEDLIIRCDLHERILNPAQLPYYSHFTLHPDSASMKTFPTTSKALGMVIPVFKIVVKCLMPSKELCDSIVFGMPMVAQPTACWKIDWDKLEKNQQVFRSLCHSLLIKNLVMIGQLENTIVSTKRQHGQLEDKPQGYFAFLPAENGSFLVKSLAAQELLLPFHFGTDIDAHVDQTGVSLNASLAKLEVIDTFNPLLWTSRLYECLKTKYQKTDPKQSKKRHETPNSERVVSGRSFFLPDRIAQTPYQPRASSSQHLSGKSITTTKGRPVLPFPTDL